MGRLSKDATSEGPRRVFCACDKAHERPESSGGGRTKKVQSGERRFETSAELGVAVDQPQRTQQMRCKESAAGNVDTITRGEQDMIGIALAAIVKFES